MQLKKNPILKQGRPVAWAVRLMLRVCWFACLLMLLQPWASRAADTYDQTILAIQKQIESGNLDQARSLIAEAARRFPHNGGVENLLGVVEIQQGNTAAASKAFSQAIAHNPRLTGAYLNLARMKMEGAATDRTVRAEALRLSLKILQLEPTNEEANYQAATIFFWNKDYRSSLAQLEKLSAAGRQKIGAQALLCADHAALGPAQAAAEAAHALAANPDLTEQDAETCLAGLRSAHRADLIDLLYSAAATRHALSPAGLRIVGLAQEAEGKFQLARTTLESAFAANPQSVDILEDLARVAKAANDNQGALGYLAHARDLQPDNAALPYEFAAVCVRMGLLAEARKALTEALRLSPDNADYNLAMGIVVSFSADPSKAIPYLTRYHSLRPKDPRGVLELGAASYRGKDYETATRWLREAVTDPTTAPDAHYYLGRIARQEGRLDVATAELKEALAMRPDQPDALAELGQISLQSRQFDQASSYFDQSLRKDPDNYGANFGLLQLYARTGDARRDQQAHRFEQIKDMKQEQEKEMMRVIEIRPNDPMHSPN